MNKSPIKTARKAPSPSPSGASFVMRQALSTLVALALSVAVVVSIDTPDVADIAPLFCFAIFLQFVPILWDRSPDPFSPPCLSGFLSAVALVAGLAYYVHNGAIEIVLLPQLNAAARKELIQIVVIAYCVGTLSYYAGYYLSWGKKLKGMMPNIAGAEWDRGRLVFACVVCIALFLPAYVFFQGRVGTELTDITRLSAGKAVWREEPTLSWLNRAVGFGFLPIHFFVALSLPKPRTRNVILALLAMVVMSVLITRLGQRGTAVFFGMTVLIVIHYLYRRVPSTLLFGLTFVAMIAVNTLGAYRQSAPNEAAISEAKSFSPIQVLANHEADRQRMAALAVVFDTFPSQKDHLLGESWAAIPVTFVPRWLWPEKRNLFMWRDTAIIWNLVGAPVPTSYLGLLYVNFSWIGIVGGMFGWGLFHRGLYEWLLANQKDRSVVLLYSSIVLFFGLTLLQMSATIQFALPAWAIIVFIRRRRRVANARTAMKPPPPPRPPTEPALPAPL